MYLMCYQIIPLHERGNRLTTVRLLSTSLLKEKFENKKLNTSNSKHNIPTFIYKCYRLQFDKDQALGSIMSYEVRGRNLMPEAVFLVMSDPSLNEL